jgi:hypothetical protein
MSVFKSVPSRSTQSVLTVGGGICRAVFGVLPGDCFRCAETADSDASMLFATLEIPEKSNSCY